jgi:hypothetical protein
VGFVTLGPTPKRRPSGSEDHLTTCVIIVCCIPSSILGLNLLQTIAFLKPASSNAIFQFSIPATTAGIISSGVVFSTQYTMVQLVPTALHLDIFLLISMY